MAIVAECSKFFYNLIGFQAASVPRTNHFRMITHLTTQSNKIRKIFNAKGLVGGEEKFQKNIDYYVGLGTYTVTDGSAYFPQSFHASISIFRPHKVASGLKSEKL